MLRDRVKWLVNVGELSKAMSALVSHGVASLTDTIVEQLRAKNPRRPEQVVRPSEEDIAAERNQPNPNQPNQPNFDLDLTELNDDDEKQPDNPEQTEQV